MHDPRIASSSSGRFIVFFQADHGGPASAQVHRSKESLAAFIYEVQDWGVQELSPGSLLGHYKIVRRLGQGGMGVVYEAVDQKLGRHVAIKLLTEASRDSSAALERFWREARAASSLNHPGICTIHELNESAETPFIVMELLEGDSLDKVSNKLYRGQAMPYPKLLEMGVQLADALDAAHRKGILHRDIKPANIFVTNSGQAKLLDFGLAKLESVTGDFKAGADPDSPTAVDPLTSSGSSVGTVAYMSPEQARAEPLDARSDLFSLGVVLYEMATGRHPFAGASTAVVFDRILNHPPVAPVSLNAQLPVELEDMLNKTLEKDRELRCQAAAELRGDLKRLQRKSASGSASFSQPSAPGSASVSGPSPITFSAPTSQTSSSHPTPIPGSGANGPVTPLPRGSSSGTSSPNQASGFASAIGVIPAEPRARSRWPIFAVAALIVLAAAGFAAWRFWPRPRPFTDVSVNQVTNAGTIERIALSADGRFLAEAKNDGGQRTLWERNTATNTDTQIQSAFGNEYLGLAFSPDGNYLYFTRGTPENNSLRALYVMPVFGGKPKQLIVDIDSIISFSPDGNRFAYIKWTPDRKDQYTEIHVADKDGSNNQVLYKTPQEAGPPVWSPDGGRLAWIGTVGAGAKYALQLFDLSTKKVTTIMAPADNRFQNSVAGETNLAWTPDGAHLLFFYLKPHTDHAQIGMITAPSGEFHPVTNDVNSYSQLALSSDGRTLATVLTEIASSIAYYKPEGGAPLSSTPLRITPTRIVWADEDRLLFIVPRIAIGSMDRTTGNTQNFDAGDIDLGLDISRCTDGHILFTGFPKGAAQARVFRMDPDGANIIQLTSSGIARNPLCSADSRQVYYSAGESAAFTASLWVVPLAGGTPRQVLPPEAARSFRISGDGKLASCSIVVLSGAYWKIFDLAKGRTLSDLPADASDIGSSDHFSLDGRAMVQGVLRGGGRTLLYEPLDGSAPHPMIDPLQEAIRDFGWSPSGKQLAVLRLKSSSDVVLITDANEKGK
jgi:eukaryotic-like serine/threonine-protein kinase